MLSDLILLLGLNESEVDGQMRAKLDLILAGATARLKLLLGGAEMPDEMRHIVLDVAAARFNRIGSEGLSGHTVEGESLSFTDNDFAQFMDEIAAWLQMQEGGKRGKLVFI